MYHRMPPKKKQKANTLHVYDLSNVQEKDNVLTVSNTTRTTRKIATSVPVESGVDTNISIVPMVMADEASVSYSPNLGSIPIKTKAKRYENSVSCRLPFFGLDGDEIRLG
jgi:hypothetical protein